jgi:oxygen-dependent protoporphyrinogen oxidase
MPQYTVGHSARVAEVERLLARHPGVVVAGSAFHGVSVPDCVASAERAARAVLASLDGFL